MEQDNERDYLGRQYAPSEPYGAFGPQARETAGKPADADGRAGSGDRADAAAGKGGAGTDTDPAPAGTVRTVQIGTVVWGLVLTVLAVLLILVNTVNLRVDPVLLVLCLTLGAGLALLAGGFLAALCRRRVRLAPTPPHPPSQRRYGRPRLRSRPNARVTPCMCGLTGLTFCRQAASGKPGANPRPDPRGSGRARVRKGRMLRCRSEHRSSAGAGQDPRAGRH